MIYRIEKMRPARSNEKVLWIGGRPGVELASRVEYRLHAGDEELWRAVVLWRHDGPFEAEQVWEKAGIAVLAGGTEFYALDLETGKAKLHEDLNGYFGSVALEPEGQRLYVCDSRDLHAFDVTLSRVWSSSVAIDGVLVQDFERERLIVKACMDPFADTDPPQALWDEVVLDRATGRELSRRRI